VPIFSAVSFFFHGTEGDVQAISWNGKHLAQQGFCPIFTIPDGREMLRQKQKCAAESGYWRYESAFSRALATILEFMLPQNLSPSCERRALC
jgi:hypothetical protein